MNIKNMSRHVGIALDGKIKNKNVFLLALFVAGFLLTFGVHKAFAASTVCADAGGTSDETCMTIEANSKSSTGYYSPAGYDCTMRGVCSGAATACCKKDSTSTSTSKKAVSGSTSSGGGTSFTNPLNYKTVDQLLSGILGAIQKIIVMLALVFIVIGAVMILVSAGDSGMVEKGKKAITMALVGFAIGVAAPSILKELAGVIGWNNTGAVSGALTLSQIAVKVLNFLLGTMGILALIMMVIGAIMYLTSAGDEDRASKGKDIFKYAMIGLIMAMASMVLVTQIAKFFV